MGVKGTGTWGSLAWFMFVISFWKIGASCGDQSTVLASVASCHEKSENFIDHQHARRQLDDIAASITIDCGTPEGFSSIEDETELKYVSDNGYINTGENRDISSNFMSATLQKSLASVRSFPEGNKNCYEFKPPEGKDTVYFLRASFMYGNFDGLDKLPEFDLYVGVNAWDTLKFDNASHVVIKEIIHTPVTDEIYVCLLNTGKGTPFISTLELRHFHNNIYKTVSGALLLYRRLDFGSTSNRIIRYEDDRYDRIWYPYQGSFESINTSSTTDSLVESDYRLPSAVMRTAIRPMNVNESLKLEFDSEGPILQFYVYMHFAELENLQGDQYREFNIELNGIQWTESVVPKYLESTTIPTQQSVRGGSKLSFLLYRTSNSTLPPILNAMEIYTVKDFLQQPTDQEDVKAIMEIKSSYAMHKIWQGDPCAPIPYSWDGLKCSYNGYHPPKIISLNLSSRGLTGKILPSISQLKSLHSLDLSNNGLTGTIPELLSQLSNLSVLYLQGNKLSGSIPAALKTRQEIGSLDLRVEGNPCLLKPCKKKRGIVIPVVAAVVCSLVIVLALLAVWIYRRKRGTAVMLGVKSQEEKEGSFKSDNRPFTYDEIVNITNNFQRVLGKGGFGTVYHGYLSDGTQVAVKMLSQSSNQGSKQFRTEAQLLMRVHHRNLAAFIGYCNDGTNMGIIYEYMAGGNLQQYLLDETKETMSWKDRLHCAVDAAQGLEYLHCGCKPPIIHRDVKTANILLNEKMQAKLADFGFSKYFLLDSESHVSTTVVGTVGYLDPEYYTFNRLTEKSDVYSFGIVLLELITGQPALIRTKNNTHIVQWVRPFLEKGDIRRLIDPRLGESFDTNSVWKAVEIAMICVSSVSIKRPTMSLVVTELKECLEMEIAREQTSMMESKGLRSINSIDMRPVDLETEMGPQPR